MSVKKRWKDLSPRTRRLVLAAGAVEACGKVVALADLRSRPAAQVRGPKWLWGAAVLVVNTVGSLSYFTVGRKR